MDRPSWDQLRPGDLVEYKNAESYHVVVVVKKTDEYISVTESGSHNKALCGGLCLSFGENQLMEQLDGAGQAVLAKLIKSQHETDSITALENFILGFRLGVRMMAECMDDSDGDIRNGGG